MINTVSVRFTWYDENGVAAITSVVPYKEFASIIYEGVDQLPHGDFLRLKSGSIQINEVQLIKDSVCIESFLTSCYLASGSDLNSALSCRSLQPSLHESLVEAGIPDSFWEAFIDVKSSN